MSTTTVRIKAAQIYKDWHVIDAAGRPLGRVATEAATLLRGKHKPTYEPHLDDGDFVVIINAAEVTLSGNKMEQMRYHRHTGYPGGLRTRTFTEQMDRSPMKVLESAVWGMLPKGPLGRKIIRHLKVYPGPNHPHQSQITGSERAKAVREAALAESLGVQRKPRRLRPLSVPDDTAEVAAAARAARKETKARAKGGATVPAAAPPVEEIADATPVNEELVEEAMAEAPENVEAPVEEKPRRTRARKAATEAAESADTTAEAPAEEKPKRTRARKAATETAELADAVAEAPVEEKPKRTRARKTTAAKAEEGAEEAPKPRRSRAKKKETEPETEGEES